MTRSSAPGYDLLAESPIGPLWVAVAPEGVAAITFGGDEAAFRLHVEKLSGETPRRSPAEAAGAITQISQYLSGERRGFELPVQWSVLTPFQQQVLRLVYFIPYGELRTYSDIARAIGRPSSLRAVGRANATNPIPLIIPCHRVIGSDGSLRGYGGGLETKAWLLRMEGSWLL